MFGDFFQCHIECNHPKISQFHKTNFLTNFLIFSELFIVTHSFPVRIMSTGIPLNWTLSCFFSTQLWGKKVGCFFYPKYFPNLG